MPARPESTIAAVKQAVDLVAVVGEYLPLHRAGSKYKALCPFHDDHNPSLEIHPERQMYKCWSCGAGGDVIDFVQNFERIEFPEALRMLAERAGVALDEPEDRAAEARQGPRKGDILAALEWAAQQFAEALARDAETQEYLAGRGITPESVARFGLGLAADRRDWLQRRAGDAGFSGEVLEIAGLIARNDENNLTRDRFRGRLMFPIRDGRGRVIAFGGRVLPATERRMVEAGLGVAKYLNSPETPVFQKRRTLYAADLARDAARKAGWVAVVEGYTDVIAAHQAGLANCVGTLGTALGDDHVAGLRRLADRVVLVFDGDDAGQKAADRALELFLGHEIDVRVLTLPDGLDPADFLGRPGGATDFTRMVESASDPLEFVLDRAGARHDLGSAEGARRAAEWVLSILAKVPHRPGAGLDLKLAKALDSLGRRLGVPVSQLGRELRRLRRPATPRAVAPLASEPDDSEGSTPPAEPLRLEDLDSLDRELILIVLNEPALLRALRTRVEPEALRDGPLRQILQSCYDGLAAAGGAPYDSPGPSPTPDSAAILSRLADPAVRSLAAGLLLPPDPTPMPEHVRPAPWPDRLAGVLAALAERRRLDHLRDLRGALEETDEATHPDEYRALRSEYLRLLSQRPAPKKKTTAS